MSPSVFEDLGFSDEESAEHSLRVRLAVQIKRYIANEGLTQDGASALFGIPQPTISKIVRLNLRNISLTYLLRMIMRAGLAFTLSSSGTPESVGANIRNCRTAVAEVDVKGAQVPVLPNGIELESFISTSGSAYAQHSSVMIH